MARNTSRYQHNELATIDYGAKEGLASRLAKYPAKSNDDWSDGSGFALYAKRYLVLFDSHSRADIYDVQDKADYFISDLLANNAESWKIWDEAELMTSDERLFDSEDEYHANYVEGAEIVLAEIARFYA